MRVKPQHGTEARRTERMDVNRRAEVALVAVFADLAQPTDVAATFKLLIMRIYANVSLCVESMQSRQRTVWWPRPGPG
jgi:hypothetical protein